MFQTRAIPGNLLRFHGGSRPFPPFPVILKYVVSLQLLPCSCFSTVHVLSIRHLSAVRECAIIQLRLHIVRELSAPLVLVSPAERFRLD